MVRTIQAVRAEKAPLIDGKLDDACWQNAQVVTDFITLNSDRRATYQSIGYVCYDDAHLYVGMRCLMPKGVKPAIEKGSAPHKPHDSYMFSDDIVEIMLDPGRSGSDYYQLVVSAYGSTYDSARRGGGSQNDPSWNGDWTAEAYIGDGFWSAEMAIPFHNLGISSKTGSTWGISFCREAKAPLDEYSTIAAGGTFHVASNFALLKGLDVDFRKYLFEIGPPDVRLDGRGEPPRALFSVPITNKTGTSKKVKVERHYYSANDEQRTESKLLSLDPDQSFALWPESLDLDPLGTGRTDAYIVRTAPATRKIVVADARDGTPLAASVLSRPWFYEAMRVTAEDPWRRNLSAEKTPRVSLTIRTLLTRQQLKTGRLLVTLADQKDGKTLAAKSFSGPAETVSVSFPTDQLPWGAFDARAVFQDADGKQIVAAQTVATVLPGAEHHIRVLNNLVSELMNAKQRGLLGRREIPFMNPRRGWVFFSLSGKAAATLAGGDGPLVDGRSADGPVEAMRLLPPGRHLLRIDGAPSQLIVRAIPELIYSTYPDDRTTWDSLCRGVLPHCTTILGGTSDETAMKQWKASGRRWITFAIAPGHGLGGERFIPAQQYYQALLQHNGFRHPLTDGLIVDQIGSASVAQKIEIAGALARIRANPKLGGRAYQPWYEGQVFGSEGDRAMMKTVLEAGWPFSYYIYLVEQTTERQVRTNIQDTIVRIASSADAQIPGSLRRAVVTLGYWSDVTTGQIQDIDPGRNFKILMQMQFDALANDPKLFGLYGVLWYYSPYVDEEILRFATRLYRHYGIEGRTAKLLSDPYRLPHIHNPDFEQGTKGWRISPAEPGSITVRTHPGYGHLQGRYLGGSHGDKFLVTKRSKNKPNRFSQDIRDLTPGRAYSLKMITADYRNIVGEKSVKQTDAISIVLQGVDLINAPGKNSQTTFENHYGHQLGKFKGNYHAYMNYHWYLFRAKDTAARLDVSDWASADRPGGPIGQELMYNFIVIEPYFEEGGGK